MIYRAFISAIFLLAIFAYAAHACAEEKTGNPKVINGVDPTVFITRLELKNIYDRGPDGETVNTTIIRGDYTIRRVFRLRIDIPLVYVDEPGSDSQYGLGDLSLRVAGLLAQTDYIRVAVGMDFDFDTATTQVLGNGKYTMRPLFATSFYPTSWFTIVFPFLKYERAYYGDDARPDVHAFEVETDFQFDLPHDFWADLESHFTVDFANENRRGWAIEAEFGKLFTKHIGAWIHPGVGVAGEKPYDFSIEAGIRYIIKY